MDEYPQIADIMMVSQNYPNPFSETTTIHFDLRESCVLSLDISDITGKKVMEVNKGLCSPGQHTIHVDGSSLPSGLYFYTVHAGGFSETKKMVVE